MAGWEKTQELKGYVTQFHAIKHLGVGDLERALGFGAGALAKGYAIYGLAARVEIDDFVWRDRTAFSGGWHGDPSIMLSANDPYIWGVQRIDELRAALGKRFNYVESMVDAELTRLRWKWTVDMNACHGPNRIVKVLPPLGTVTRYPDSPLRNIPQWEIKPTARKKFELMYVH
jgi:hypothetical protein